MSEIIELPQQFFSVPEFREVMANWHIAIYHDETAGTYVSEDENHRSKFHYRILGDDVVIWHEQMTYHSPHRSHISPKENDKFYLFGYVFQANRPIVVRQNGTHTPLNQGGLFFCNNYAEHTLHIPENCTGTTLQFVVSHSFIMEYINPEHLKNPTLHNIIHGTDETYFTMKQAPGPIRRQMNHLIRQLLRPPSEPMNKLHILQKTSTVLDLFFKMHLNNPAQPIQSKEEKERIPQVAAYLNTMIHVPFPGIEFLAHRYNLSVSSLKRAFKQQYSTTPLRYYRKKQVHHACRQLQIPGLSVADISDQLGFNSPGNFIRAFKKEMGSTPGQYRKQAKRQGNG